MSNRLPTVGGDNNDWGTILNDFLEVSHNADGTLNTSAVSGAGAVLTTNNLSDLQSSSVARSNLGLGSAATQSSSSFLAAPALSDTATIYVTADGSNSNDGKTWSTGVATVQHAITLLPANGGIIEVGYGQSFAGFTTPDSMTGVTIRGRGTGLDEDGSSPGIYATSFNSPIVVQGHSLVSPAVWDTGLRLEDFAVSGCTGDGLWIQSPEVSLKNVYSTWNSGRGIYVSAPGTPGFTSFFCTWTDVHCVSNGSHGLESYGQGYIYNNFVCIANGGNGALFDGGEENTFIAGVFQQNTGPGVSGSNTNTNFMGTHFEANAVGLSGNSSFQVGVSGTSWNFIGCFFVGDSGTHIGIAGSAPAVRVAGCSFEGHTSESIYLNQAECIAEGNYSTDPQFIVYYDGITGNTNYPTTTAANHFNFQASTVSSREVINLTGNGAVTINAAKGNLVHIYLGANATSSSLTNPSIGQEITIAWIQDGTGSRTYAWPSNCRFAGNSAPAASTGANLIDMVTFAYINPLSPLWIEKSRAIGVPNV